MKKTAMIIAMMCVAGTIQAEDSAFHIGLDYGTEAEEIVGTVHVDLFALANKKSIKAPSVSLKVGPVATPAPPPATLWYNPKDHPWWFSLAAGLVYVVGENNEWFQHGDGKSDDRPAVPVAQDTADKTTPAQIVATDGGEIITHQTSCPDILIAKGPGSKVRCDEFPPSEE